MGDAAINIIINSVLYIEIILLINLSQKRRREYEHTQNNIK